MIIKSDAEKILNLLERKVLVEMDREREVRNYQEWVLNYPYKFVSSIALLYGLQKVHEIFDKYSLPNWVKFFAFSLPFSIWLVANIYFFFLLIVSFREGRKKICHYSNQIVRIDEEIKKLLKKKNSSNGII